MAKNQTSDNVTDSSVDELLTQKQRAWDTLAPIRATWPDKERLLISRLSDSYSQKNASSHVTDSHLSTIVFERQSRVAAQLPTGKCYSLSSKDDGAAALMNIVLQKYIIPGANSQFDLLTKFRMSGVYASVYGSQPILIDYRIGDDYIGPDCWLIPTRNFLPQPGKNAIQDMDWCMVSTMVSVSYLENIAKRSTTKWNKKNINALITEAKKGAVPARDVNSDKKSAVENIRASGTPPADKGPGARVELVTKYEAGKDGHWITFAPDYKTIGVLRDIPNPHKSGKIPIVMRQCFPLVDSIFGLGDFERGITLQKAKDSLINLYLQAVKLSIFPPLKVDLSGVTASTIKYQAGAKWLVKDMDAVQQFQNNPSGMETFQATYQFLTGALVNQNGSSNTSLTSQDTSNPQYGRTPEALQMQQQQESARDNWDRFQLEKTVEFTYEYFMNLIGSNQEKPINFHIFDDDIKTLREAYGDDDDSLDEFLNPINSKVAKVTVAKSKIGGQYRFLIDDSSSLGQDQKQQSEALQAQLEMYAQNPQMWDAIFQRENMEFKPGQAFKQKMINDGVQDWDDILIDHSDDEGDEAGMDADNPQAQQQAMAHQQLIQQGIGQLQTPEIQQAAMRMFGQQQQAPQPVAQGMPMQPQQMMPQQQGVMQ